ncbi:MAG: methylated-DNA--[protein]-cysteine S-methyltransferase [Anaerolineae bacterium]
MTPESYYLPLASPCGELALVWHKGAYGARLRQCCLSSSTVSALQRLRAAYGELPLRSCPEMDDLADRLLRFLSGEPLRFDLALAEMDACSAFQRRVLLAEYGVPRGRVTAYAGLACSVGLIGAARAAGAALARNPFPLLIPCHRTVRNDGRIGGYQGGPAMKRRLLEMEGVPFLADGRVDLDHVLYMPAP